MAIREILQEELENSLRMERNYRMAVDRLPKGSLVRKRIRGREYCYLAKRVGDRVEFEYLGKLPPRLIEKYEQAKTDRAKYRKLLAEVRAQIKLLRKVLRGKQAI